MIKSNRQQRGLSLAMELAGFIKCQIFTGVYVDGSQLPTAIEIAKRFDVDPNTARAAYARLKSEGFVDSVRGRGTFVRDQARRGDPERLRGLLADILAEARKIDLSTEELATIIWIHGRFSIGEKKAWYIDDWHPYMDVFARDLQFACGAPITSCVLADLPVQIENKQGPGKGDLVFVTRFNLDRVTKMVANPDVKFFAIAPRMAPSVIDGLNKLPEGTNLGVVCIEDKFARISGKVIERSNVPHRQVYANTTEIATLPPVFEQAGAITISTVALSRLQAAKARLPNIPIIPFCYELPPENLSAAASWARAEARDVQASAG